MRTSLTKSFSFFLSWKKMKEGNVLFNDALNTFIYGYMASDVLWRTTQWTETCCRHMDYFFRSAARVLLYAPSHRQDNTYHCLCYTSRGALAGPRNSSMGPPLNKIISDKNALLSNDHLTWQLLHCRRSQQTLFWQFQNTGQHHPYWK